MLNNKYKNYKFKIEEITDKKELEAYHAIKICVKRVEGEILLSSLNGGGEFSLYLQDRFFNFNVDVETKRISSFDGEIYSKQIKIANLKLPTKVKKAILSLNTNEEITKGSGSYIEFDTDNILYDKENGILQIGAINSGEILYKIFNNAYVQTRDGTLSGLMFTELDF